MSENPTENTETTETEAEDSEASSAEKTPGTFPSPIPALIKASDRAERPGFRSASNSKTKVMKKKAGKGKKRR
ncbi:MAG: hypothetical protein ACI9VR_000325 [Cognaticolwellia sp.]|jgi:hypothetical protein